MTAFASLLYVSSTFRLGMLNLTVFVTLSVSVLPPVPTKFWYSFAFAFTIFIVKLAVFVDGSTLFAYEVVWRAKNPETHAVLPTPYIPYAEYVPITVKSVCCHTNDKVKLGYYIADKYGLEIPVLMNGKNKGKHVCSKTHKFFNVTDAIALGLCHYRKTGGKT